MNSQIKCKLMTKVFTLLINMICILRKDVSLHLQPSISDSDSDSQVDDVEEEESDSEESESEESM